MKNDNFLKNLKDKIGSKYTPKRTILKKFIGGACKHTNFQIWKKILAPPLKSWLRPWAPT